MFHAPITQDQTPKWVVCDRDEDVSDIYVDYMDTENEENAVVTAFLHENKYDDGMQFKGIRIVEDDGTVTYWDRARCSKYDAFFCALMNMEDAAMQAPGYGADDEYDVRKEWV